MRLSLRVTGAALLGVNAGIHAYLWSDGYRTLHVIGPSFLAAVISASVLGLMLLTARWTALVALAGAGLEAGTAGALLIAWRHGLFGFVESARAPLFRPALATEAAGMLVLLGLAALTARAPRRAESRRLTAAEGT